VPDETEDEPGFRLEGTQAHTLAEQCLKHDFDTWQGGSLGLSMFSANMMEAVQVYLDYVRSRPGWALAELKLHRPEFHDLAYGTADAVCLDPGHLEIIDYKHGAGLAVEVEENPQGMYYAGMVIDELGHAWTDDEEIKITIVQPRKPHSDGPIRTWITTVGHLRRWMVEVLRPAMVQTSVDAFLSPGDHCRFCPAKLVCPAFLAVGSEFSRLDIDQLQALSDPVLARLLTKKTVLRMVLAALDKEAARRMIENHGELPGWKVVPAMGDRVWKPGAPVFGWQERKPMTPAQVEDCQGGKLFTAEWAEKPFRGYSVVPDEDRRKAAKFTSEEFAKNIAKEIKTG
jgi:hypothetical protein